MCDRQRNMFFRTLILSLVLCGMILIPVIGKPSDIDKPDDCGCGSTKYKDKDRKVTNGLAVDKMYKYPWVVSIHYDDHTPKPHGICHGALISQSTVITSARCVMSRKATFSCLEKTTPKCFLKPNEVKIGQLGKDNKKPSKMLEVKKIIPHPEYNHKLSSNDLALIQFSKPLNCSKYFSPICIPKTDFTKRGQNVTLAGWGRIDDKMKESDIQMREGEAQRIKSKYCAKEGLDKKKLYCCTPKNVASCQADVGSVIFAWQNKNISFALGVISSPICLPFCSPATPITAMLIPAYYDFIKENVKDLPEPINGTGKASPIF